jgi:hypothetical protein
LFLLSVRRYEIVQQQQQVEKKNTKEKIQTKNEARKETK